MKLIKYFNNNLKWLIKFDKCMPNGLGVALDLGHGVQARIQYALSGLATNRGWIDQKPN